MNILVIGANGGGGSLLVQQIAKKKGPFSAGGRQSEQIKALKTQGMKANLVDVEKELIKTLNETFKTFDKIIFLIGSG
ncbi:oxidoreductase, partial [Staphylococcus aureus]